MLFFKLINKSQVVRREESSQERLNDILEHFIPQSDYILFVTSVDRPFSESEVSDNVFSETRERSEIDLFSVYSSYVFMNGEKKS